MKILGLKTFYSKWFYVLLLVLAVKIVFGQNSIVDSLKVEFSKSADSTKSKILSDLCWEYRNISLDSAIRLW
jgi:hypothetical protein